MKVLMNQTILNSKQLQRNFFILSYFKEENYRSETFLNALIWCYIKLIQFLLRCQTKQYITGYIKVQNINGILVLSNYDHFIKYLIATTFYSINLQLYFILIVIILYNVYTSADNLIRQRNKTFP